jgi:hypothetical protein
VRGMLRLKVVHIRDNYTSYKLSAHVSNHMQGFIAFGAH